VFITTGGRRTGMTKLLPVGKEAHWFLRQNFNLHSATVEATMFSRDEELVKWRIVNTLRVMVDSLTRAGGGLRPAIVLAGYSYGGAHLVKAMNEILTRRSFAAYEPDLVALIDPCGALNTLEHLHVVPVGERILNFRGVYIVPQPRLRYFGKLVTKTLDEYPSVEGSQPVVLLREADYREVMVYDRNRADLSPHNLVPLNIVDYRDEDGVATYLEIIKAELGALSEPPAAEPPDE
jgi:hypothetical protein